MKNDLVLSVLQWDLSWENPSKNYDRVEGFLQQLSSPQDLILLPEMFTTGFTMNTSVAETFSEEMLSLQKMREWARTANAAVAGSISVRENDNYFNRMFFVKPDGTYELYDKRHLFRLSDENRYFTKGNNSPVVEWRNWKIKPLICYDLRFPVWSRNSMVEGSDPAFDLLFYVASWPAVRSFPWKSLLTARAIENQVYCAGVNRCGIDGEGFEYSGDSIIHTPLGDTLGSLKNEEGIITSRLSASDLTSFRERFPVLLDADPFALKG